MSSKVAVIAIGGNSLITDKDHQTVPDQYRAAGETVQHIVKLIEAGWNVAIGHGNGPQIGFILRRSELAAHELHEVPLDVCGADTQGAIGYALQQHFYNQFLHLGLEKQVITVVTQIEVYPDDPAFQNPSKPIGSFMNESQAQRYREAGWTVIEDAGRGWRRVVPSPFPQKIIEEQIIKDLIAAGVVVITIGGGGIPVTVNEKGQLEGIAAVIDKDYAAALLAQKLKAELFIISTGVEKVAINFGRPNQTWLDHLTLDEAKFYLAEGDHFAKGSMAPKIEAVIRYLEQGFGEAIITNPENISLALAGKAGTRITL